MPEKSKTLPSTKRKRLKLLSAKIGRFIIREGRGPSLSELAKLEGIESRSHALKLVRAMEQEGLIKRKSEQRHRQEIIVVK